MSFYKLFQAFFSRIFMSFDFFNFYDINFQFLGDFFFRIIAMEQNDAKCNLFINLGSETVSDSSASEILNDAVKNIDDCRTPLAELPIKKDFSSPEVTSKAERRDLGNSAANIAAMQKLDETPAVPPRHKKRRVTELRCPEVRWFYRKKGETKWNSFRG